MRQSLPHVLRLTGAALVLAGLAACHNSPPAPPNLTMADRLRIARNIEGPGAATSVDALRQQAEAQPNDAAAQQQWSEAAEAANRYTEAAAGYRRLVEQTTPTAALLIRLGRMELSAGESAQAAESFQRALTLAPQDRSALTGLGVARDVLGDSAGAQQAHRSALSLAPSDWGLRGNLALSQLIGQNAPGAIATMATAESDLAAPRRAKHNLALALCADGQRERAIRLLRGDMSTADAEKLANEFEAFSTSLRSIREPAPTRAPQTPTESDSPGAVERFVRGMFAF